MAVMAEYVLNVQELDETGKTYVFPVRRAWLTHVLEGTQVGADPAADEGRVEFHAHKQGADVVLHGHVKAGLLTACSRCLEDARLTVDTPLTTLFTARGEDLRPEPDEVELSPEELAREFFSGDRIALDDIVREHLLLEVPIQPLCSEHCPGIPVPAAVAGPADLRGHETDGVDPRLAPLLKLVGKRAPTEE
jgi:uncharacterized protein